MSTLATDSQIPAATGFRETIVCIVCIDCDATVFEWSTPHTDRCWECAETPDLAAGR